MPAKGRAGQSNLEEPWADFIRVALYRNWN